MAFECSVGDWHRTRDPGTGAYYYANTKTLAASWTVPPEWVEPAHPGGAALTVDDCWTQVADEASGRLYYVNTMTMESSWEKPANWKGHRKLTIQAPLREDSSDDGSVASPSAHSDSSAHSVNTEFKSLSTRISVMTADSFVSISQAGAITPTPSPHDSPSTTPATTPTASNKEKQKFFPDTATSRSEQAVALSQVNWTDQQKTGQRQERIAAMKALIQNEFAYFLDLQVIAVEFELTIQSQKQQNGKEVLLPGELRAIIRNIPELHEAHIGFAQNITSLTDEQLEGPVFIGLLESLFSSFDPYSKYLSAHKSIKTVQSFVERLELERPQFKAVLEHIQSAKCMSGVARPLLYYLDAPTTRLPVYGTLVLNVLKTIDPSTDDFKQWQELLTKVEQIIQRVEQNSEFVTMRDKVGEIQKHLHFANSAEIGLKLVTPTRYLVHSGEIKKKLSKVRLGSSYKSYMLYVFNDMVMYTSMPDKFKRIIPKRCMPMVGMKVEHADKGVNFRIDSVVKNVQFKAASKEECDQWVKVLQDTLKRSPVAEEGKRQKPPTLIAPVRGW